MLINHQLGNHSGVSRESQEGPLMNIQLKAARSGEKQEITPHLGSPLVLGSLPASLLFAEEKQHCWQK